MMRFYHGGSLIHEIPTAYDCKMKDGDTIEVIRRIVGCGCGCGKANPAKDGDGGGGGGGSIGVGEAGWVGGDLGDLRSGVDPKVYSI